MNVRIFCFALLAVAPLAACSGTTNDGDLTETPVDTDSSELKICDGADCGLAPGMPAVVCSDGSTGGNTGRCVKTKKSTQCHWEIRSCPPPKVDCTKNDACPGPAPGAPSQICWDGSTAGPTCAATGDGCGWQITTCPTAPPELACGANVCKKGQTCCSGTPLPEPMCVDGMMCPISQRHHKKDISYLSATERQRLNDELMSFRLATYRYKSEPSSDREHLGFIIDDVAPSAAVL